MTPSRPSSPEHYAIQTNHEQNQEPDHQDQRTHTFASRSVGPGRPPAGRNRRSALLIFTRSFGTGVVMVLRITRGYSPDYLLKEVATGRENYYTGAVAAGEPPGRWWGAGAEALGLHGPGRPAGHARGVRAVPRPARRGVQRPVHVGRGVHARTHRTQVPVRGRVVRRRA